jgi:serine/threonine protein phosphatase PrpC
MKLDISTATDEGPKPQDDRFIVRDIDFEYIGYGKGTLLAVTDGYSAEEQPGFEVSDAIMRRLVDVFRIGMVQEYGDIKRALLKSVAIIQKTIEESYAGSTLSIIFLNDGYTEGHICTIGDSPVIISKKNGSLYIFPDDPNIGDTVKEALGDKRNPELKRDATYNFVELEAGDTIMVATDGIYNKGQDTILPQSKVLIQKVREGADAEHIVKDALIRETGDNVTVIVASIASAESYIPSE